MTSLLLFTVAGVTCVVLDSGAVAKHYSAQRLDRPCLSLNTQMPAGLWRRARDIPL